MKKNLRFLVMAAVGLVGAVAFSSCVYDPYYTSVGGSYSTGYGTAYGYGYGYGGSTFTTDIFVGTGNPRWGYDPYCYSYYDYTRRAYYDPYLNGYYPIGYRPPVVYGVSHPYGWRPGSGYLRPPVRVTNTTIRNYRDREAAYRSSGYISGRSVRQQPTNQSRYYGQQPSQNTYGGDRYRGRTGSSYQQSVSPYSRQIQGTSPSSQPGRQRTGSGAIRENGTPPASRYPSRYNNPVSTAQPDNSRDIRPMPPGGSRSRQGTPQTTQNQIRPLAPPDVSRGNRPRTEVQAQPAQPQRTEGQSRGSGGGRYPYKTEREGTEPGRRGRN